MNHKLAKKSINKGVIFAFLATLFFAFSTPTNKLMLNSGLISATLLAACVYFGCGAGMLVMTLFRSKEKAAQEHKPGKKDVPWLIFMVVLDALSSILTIWGVSMCEGSTASLLGNFEIFVTVIIAAIFFKEKVSPRLLLGVILVFLASMILSVEDFSSFRFSEGAIVVMVASLCWGLENNVTKKVSHCDPMIVSIIKGFGSSITSLAVGLLLGERFVCVWMPFVAIAIGFVTYGLSFFFYLYAQRNIGASRTATIFSLSSFIGSFICFFVFLYLPSRYYIVSLAVMATGVYLASTKGEKERNKALQHAMNLCPGPMKAFKEGYKDIEMRLNDERRANLKPGDTIIFTNTEDSSDVLKARIKNIERYPSFKEVYEKYPHNRLGYKTPDEGTFEDMEQYYSKEKIEKYGALAIEVEIIK